MRLPTFVALILFVARITEREDSSIFAYYVPGTPCRLSGRERSCLPWSRNTDYRNDDALVTTSLKFSAVDTTAGLEDGNIYFSGDEERILMVYDQWRNEYGKGDFDGTRYQNFRSNYIKLMTANAAELTVARDMGYPDPEPLSLNEYGDYSPEEFHNMQNGQYAAPTSSDSAVPASLNGYGSPQTRSPYGENYYSAEEQDRIRQIYKEWCYKNGKNYDESRLEIFANNLRVVENYFKQTGKKAELNQYADVSPEEYKEIVTLESQNTQSQYNAPHVETMSTNRHTSPSTLYNFYDENEVERIQQAYMAWCSDYGKDYDESRLDIFAVNLFAIENYRTETGKNVNLNAYADLSPDEFNSIRSSGAEIPFDGGNSYAGTLPNNGSEYYGELNGVSSGTNYGSGSLSEENPLATTDEGIRTMYTKWCEYYGKVPSDDGFYYFKTKYAILEKGYLETGVEFTMNEYADLPEQTETQQPGTLGVEGERMHTEDARLAEEEERRAEAAKLEKEQNERLELARRAEGERIQAEQQRRAEEARLKEEEEHRKKEAARLEQEQNERLERARRAEEERIQAEQQRRAEEARLKEEEEKRKAEAIRLEKEQNERLERARRAEEERMQAEQQRRVEEARLKEEEEKRKAEAIRLEKEQNERLEQARRAEEERMQAEEQRRAEEARLKEEEEKRKAEAIRLEKEQNERIEEQRRKAEEQQRAQEMIQAEEERKRREEEARLQNEKMEREKFEEARRRVEEARLLEQKRNTAAAKASLEEIEAAAEKVIAEESALIDNDSNLMQLASERNRLQQERERIEEALKVDRARLNEEKRREELARIALEDTNRKLQEKLKENEEDSVDEPDPIIVPRASYLDAVAKTWVDRTAYLEALQEGRVGVLPGELNLPQKPIPKTTQEEKETRIKRSESLIDSIWNFMKEDGSDVSNRSSNYSNRLIRQADKLIEEASTQSTGVMGEELRYLKKAVDAMRRRNNDDRAAERAIVEAKDWEQIQKGLEKEAKRAKKRREHEERLAGEAREKARSLKSEKREHDKHAEEARKEERALQKQNGESTEDNKDIFSFFSSPFQANESTNGSKEENMFSFFSAGKSDVRKNAPPANKPAMNTPPKNPPPPNSMTQAVKVKKTEDSWINAVFGFFAGEKEEETTPGLGTITLEPAPRKSVFDLFVSPDEIAPAREAGRGSITIDDSKEPSIFSFFARFGISQKKEKEVDPVRLKRLMDYEKKVRVREEKLSRLRAGRSRILEEKDRKMSRKEARKLQRELDALAAGNFTSSARNTNIPQLAKWTSTPEGRITGFISDSAGGPYKLGSKITTSPIKGKIAKPGITVTTITGSKYRLGMIAPRDAIDSASGSRETASKRSSDQISPMGSFFGRLFPEENIPCLVEWTQNEDGTITGFINNKEGFEDGTQITTSPVQKGARRGMVIQTRGGSKYKLMKPQ